MMKYILIFLILFSPCSVFCQEQILLTDGSVGIDIAFDEGKIIIVRVEDSTSASGAGISVLDTLLSINGNDRFKGYDDIYNQLFGAEESSVELEILKHENSDTIKFNLKRGKSNHHIRIANFHLYDWGNDITLRKHFFYIHPTLNETTNIDSTIKLFKEGSILSSAKKSLIIHRVDSSSQLFNLGIKSGEQLFSVNDDTLQNYEEFEQLYNKNSNTEFIIKTTKNSNLNEYKIKPTSKLEYRAIESLYNFDFSNYKSYWCQLIFTNKIKNDKVFLLEFPRAEQVEIYNKTENKNASTNLLCNNKYRSLYGNQMIFELKTTKNKTDTLYLKITNQSKDEEIELYITEKDNWIKNDMKSRFIQGLFFGIMLIMGIYNFILFLYIRDQSHLYFVCYILFFGMVMILANKYYSDLFSLTESSARSLRTILIFPTLAFFILYLKSFLNQHSNNKSGKTLLNINFILIVVGLFIRLIYVQSQNIVGDIRITFLTVTLLIIITFILTYIPIINAMINRQQKAIYPAIANTLLLFTLIYSYFFDSTYFFNAEAFISVQIGIVGQILIFSIGLGQKISATEKEKNKALLNVVSQLKENENLREKVNRELEQKVNERTKELKQANVEILNQRNEIESQRDKVTEQKEEIEFIHHEISSSIDYAERLQKTILSDEHLLTQHISDHFVLLLPKDKVSGDFYWWNSIENNLIVAAADCTGHGVPGAFMSMLSVALLREIITKEYITHSGVILNKMRKEIIRTLGQKGEIGEQKDGLDIALISINLDTKICQFSGANNPLYLIRRGELIEYKGDRMPIAIHYTMERFKTYDIPLEKGDQLYMFSDGFADQFGGEKGKKFKYKAFKNLLLSISENNMTEQKKKLNSSFKAWCGNLSQIDDVLIIGLKIE